MTMLTVLSFLSIAIGAAVVWREGPYALWAERIRDGAIAATGTFAFLCLMAAVFGVLP